MFNTFSPFFPFTLALNINKILIFYNHTFLASTLLTLGWDKGPTLTVKDPCGSPSLVVGMGGSHSTFFLGTCELARLPNPMARSD
jgi:hypothetical protein